MNIKKIKISLLQIQGMKFPEENSNLLKKYSLYFLILLLWPCLLVSMKSSTFFLIIKSSLIIIAPFLIFILSPGKPITLLI